MQRPITGQGGSSPELEICISVSCSRRRLGVHCESKEGHGEIVRTRGKGGYSEKTKQKPNKTKSKSVAMARTTPGHL